MNALLITQLLEGAEEKGASLELNTGKIENQVLLQAVDRLNIDAIPRSQRSSRPADALVCIHILNYISSYYYNVHHQY